MKILKRLTVLLAVMAVAGVFLIKPVMRKVYPLEYKDEILKYSREYSVDPYLTAAVIREESRYRPEAVSHKDAHGLMQITYDTFLWAKQKMVSQESFEDIYIPDVNIKYGTYILSFLLKDFKYEEVSLAAYNAGRGRVNAWLSDDKYSHDGETLYYIPFKETREYVVKVLKSKDAYYKLYPDIF